MRTTLLLLLVPALAFAAPKAKVMKLQPLIDEVGASASKEALAAVQAAERCLKLDENWEMAQEQRIPPNQLYELLATAVVCWQGAEKKAGKAADGAPLVAWTAARARFVESYRSFVWAIDAKVSSNNEHVCKRMKTAQTELAAALAAADKLDGAMQTAAAKGWAAAQAKSTRDFASIFEGEASAQRCKP